MTVSYSTAISPGSGRGKDWAASVHRYLDALAVDQDLDDDFSGSLASALVGENRVSLVTADVQRITRKPQHSDRLSPIYHLIFIRDGAFQLSSSAFNGRIRAGEWVLLANGEAFSFETSRGCSCLVLHLSDRWLRNYIVDPAAIIDRQGDSQGSWHMALRYCFEAIAETPFALLGNDGGAAIEQVPRLLALASGVGAEQCSRNESILTRAILNQIKLHRSRPDLSAEYVAEAAGVSRRTLYAVLRKTGTTFVRELHAARLQHAAEMLRSGHHAATSIGEVAMRCGMWDPAHFARLFRQRYGETPSEYRRRALPRRRADGAMASLPVAQT